MLTLDRIQHACAARFGVTTDGLLSNRRTSGIAMARQLAMYLAHRELGLTYSEVGRAFRRDHTSAIHAVQKWSKLVETDWGRSTVAAVMADMQLPQASEQERIRQLTALLDETRETLRGLRGRLRDQERQIEEQRRTIADHARQLAKAKLQHCDPDEVRRGLFREVQDAWRQCPNVAAFAAWINQQVWRAA